MASICCRRRYANTFPIHPIHSSSPPKGISAARISGGESNMSEEQTTEQGEQLFVPSDPLAAATVTFLREHYGDDLEQVSEHRGEATIVVRPEALIRVCRALREDTQQYDFLADITA